MGPYAQNNNIYWHTPKFKSKSIAVYDWNPRCIPFNLLTMEKSKMAVVMVPLPTQSHLNQLLHLAAIISSHNIPVHFVGSASHNRQAKLRATALKPNAAASIQFHDLPTPPIATPEPNPTISNKLPLHQSPAVMAYLGLRNEIGLLVQKLSEQTTKVIVIHDRLVAEAVKVAVSIPTVESYTFTCLSALNLFCVLWEFMGKPFDVEEELNRLPSVREFIPESTLKFIANRPDHFDERDGDIYNTSRLIEGKYIDLLRRKEIAGGKKQWAIMPTLFQNFPHDNAIKRHRYPCLEWLDKQDPRSVMYVSFGSSISLTNEEIREMAAGLEESGKKFIWVVRESDKADIFAGEEKAVELPEGFEERVRERGIVLREWAPQMEILSHGSTGGFMTHCGWNSCFESFIAGVPVAAWPMHTDQPLNAIFLTETLKVGVMVREWAAREKLVEAAEIKRAVERLLSAGEGEGIRKRAEEISADIKKSMEEGGELRREVDSFITHITR